MMYTVQPGDTLNGIAQANEVSLSAVEQANPRIGNPSHIYAGETIVIPAGGSFAQWRADGVDSDADGGSAAGGTTPPTVRAGGTTPPTVSAGAPAGSFQACVISRESGGNPQVMNSSGHYGLYQFSAATWARAGGNPADFGHASVAEQNQVFAQAYALWGTSPWTPSDHC
jgi:LysM repeat protein